MVATILEGILGALLVVPMLASVIVVAGYLQRKMLGLPAFEDDGSTQFVAPPEAIKPPRRRSRRKNTNDAADAPVPSSAQPVSGSEIEFKPKRKSSRKNPKI